jgi:hypothetical protein
MMHAGADTINLVSAVPTEIGIRYGGRATRYTTRKLDHRTRLLLKWKSCASRANEI